MDKKQLTVYSLETRPEDLPPTATVWNAPRPIYGHKEWVGDFRHGTFYAAIYPDTAETESWTKANQDLDAWPVSYVTRDEVIDWVKGYYARRNLEDIVDVDAYDFDQIWESFLIGRRAEDERKGQ